jgi:hypothetical protein
MNNLIIIIIFLVSLFLGLIKYGSLADSYKGKSWKLKFVEMWNDFINFFITGLIGYYFILIRWPMLSKGEMLNVSDFALFVIFILGLFGHLCVISKNITEGVEAIIKRVLG